MTFITVLEENCNELPLELSQVKAFLKADYEEDEDEDGVILRSFRTAIGQCEGKINRSIVWKKYILSTHSPIKNNFLRLFYGTVNSVKSVKITDKNGLETVMSKDNYFLDSRRDCIFFKTSPGVFSRLDAVYAAKLATISDELLQAILFHTAKIYEDKTGYCPIPRGSLNIYKKYREIRL
ncbi:MAG: hypothetical protein LBB09_00025 [Rickettsiales bacterium]|jgi:uncharacterized phiE125 gp8 family phage protein|nr:hypothetical protein [Rickettsiales bacterium]